jgi:large subunit ribosomal protein L14e
MFEVGRVCVKLAGRDAGKKCVIVDVIDHSFVLVDGETRRKRCNIKHLEPLEKIVQLSKNAPASEVERVLKELGIEVRKTKKKSAAAKPKRLRKEKTAPQKEAKEKPAKEKKEVKKEAIKEKVEKKA